MKYVKNPIPVDAIQYLDNQDELIKFCGDDIFFDELGPYIHTLEGDMRFNSGDYVIKGIHGEIYPCKKDIFEESYSPFF